MGVTAQFERVGKSFGEIVALKDFTLSADDGELVTVVGPSGCGKSTLLRLTAGLEELTAGTIQLGGRRIDNLPPADRDVAMVFQNYALYPHMSVRQNIEFPLRMRRTPAGERQQRVEHVSDLLEIRDLLDRRPARLSGGQRQRVALARALVRAPALFLLDEPLSNLDARLRIHVRQHIRDVQRRLAVTTLYVTHDQTEAMTLGDRVVVMDAGRIQQIGTPLAVYERPANVFVAGFIGTPPMNLLPAQCRDDQITVEGQSLLAPPELRGRLPNGPVTVGVRPEAFSAYDERQNALVAQLHPATREVLGSETLVRGVVGTHAIITRLFGVARAVPARVQARTDALHLFRGDDGRRIV